MFCVCHAHRVQTHTYWPYHMTIFRTTTRFNECFMCPVPRTSRVLCWGHVPKIAPPGTADAHIAMHVYGMLYSTARFAHAHTFSAPCSHTPNPLINGHTFETLMVLPNHFLQCFKGSCILPAAINALRTFMPFSQHAHNMHPRCTPLCNVKVYCAARCGAPPHQNYAPCVFAESYKGLRDCVCEASCISAP